MSVSKLEAKNILLNKAWAQEWAAGNARCQVRRDDGTWIPAQSLNSVNFELPPDRFRIRPDHKFTRHVVIWVDERGVVQEKIFKGDKRFADECADRLRRYKGYRDAKVHTISVPVEV